MYCSKLQKAKNQFLSKNFILFGKFAQKAFQRRVARHSTTKPRNSHNMEILTVFEIFQVVLPNKCGFSLRDNILYYYNKFSVNN